MALAYLQIFADKEELLEPLDDAERGRLLTAMLAYALHDEAPELPGNERYVWPVFRQMIDQSKASLAIKQAGGKARHSTAQQEAAEASTSQQKSAAPQQEAAEAPIIQDSRIKNQESRIRNQDRGGKRTRFTPPTEADVLAYASEHGLSINARLFVAHYTAKGWKISGTLMEDWRAAVVAWVSRDGPGTQSSIRGQAKTVEQQQYTQREYVHTEDAMDALMAKYTGGGACGACAN